MMDYRSFEDATKGRSQATTICMYLAIALYVCALALPALETEAECLRGIALLSVGGFSILSDLSLFVIWLSNLLFFFSLALVWSSAYYTKACLLSLLATILGGLMLLKGEITYDCEMPILRYHWGYYAWVGSFVALLLSSLSAVVSRRLSANSMV